MLYDSISTIYRKLLESHLMEANDNNDTDLYFIKFDPRGVVYPCPLGYIHVLY